MSLNTMKYKGYTARIEYSAEDECLVGHVAGINAFIGFHGDSIAEVTQAFHDVLDCYLSHCEKLGRSPETPRSGRLLLRLPTELHTFVAQEAESTGNSVNGIIVGAVRSLRDHAAGIAGNARTAAAKGRPARRKARPAAAKKKSKGTLHASVH